MDLVFWPRRPAGRENAIEDCGGFLRTERGCRGRNWPISVLPVMRSQRPRAIAELRRAPVETCRPLSATAPTGDIGALRDSAKMNDSPSPCGASARTSLGIGLIVGPP